MNPAHILVVSCHKRSDTPSSNVYFDFRVCTLRIMYPVAGFFSGVLTLSVAA